MRFTYPPSPLEFAPGLAALGAATEGQPSAPIVPSATPAQAAAARGAPVNQQAARRQRPQPSGITIPGYEDPVPAGLRAFAGQMPSVMSGNAVYNPANLPTGRTLNLRPTLPPAALATLGAGMGFAGIGDAGVGSWTDFLKPAIAVAQQVIPGKTVVGKLIGSGQSDQPAPPPPTPTMLFTPQSNTQKYLLYGAGGLAAVLVLSMVMRSRGAGGTYSPAPVAGW